MAGKTLETANETSTDTGARTAKGKTAKKAVTRGVAATHEAADGARRSRPPSDDVLVGLLLEVMGGLFEHFGARSAEFDLSPTQAKTIMALERPTSMRELAEQLRCDASNITGIVDRLEARGLVERRVRADDRRVKQLVLTDAGEDLRRAHRERLYDDTALFGELSPAERLQLAHLLGRVARR